MFSFSDLVSNDMLSDEEYDGYNLTEPAVIFGCTDIDPEIINITIRSDYDSSLAVQILGEYLSFLAGEKYIRKYLSEKLSRQLDDEWIDDVEIYEVGITVNDDDDYGATVSLGSASLFGDSEVELDFDRETIEEIR